MAFVEFIIALVVVFAIGMVIRYFIKKATKKAPSSSNIVIKPQINIGQQNSAAPSAAAKAAFCPNCGTKVDGDSAFCGNCGAKVG
jgi:hypothetical protein